MIPISNNVFSSRDNIMDCKKRDEKMKDQISETNTEMKDKEKKKDPTIIELPENHVLNESGKINIIVE